MRKTTKYKVARMLSGQSQIEVAAKSGLELLSRRNRIKFTLLTCNTKEELEHHLNLFKKKKG